MYSAETRNKHQAYIFDGLLSSFTEASGSRNGSDFELTEKESKLLDDS